MSQANKTSLPIVPRVQHTIDLGKKKEKGTAATAKQSEVLRLLCRPPTSSGP